MAWQEQFEIVVSGHDVQPLKGAIEVVHRPGVVAVNEYLGLSWTHLQPQRCAVVVDERVAVVRGIRIPVARDTRSTGILLRSENEG